MTHCIQNLTTKNPCRKIVQSQESTLSQHQVPEPWSGNIEQAPILFISSNPSISDSEEYPTLSWSDSEMSDFFNNRFGGGRKAWAEGGRKSLQRDGTYSRVIPFWNGVRHLAKELLLREPVPGNDYAITEIVHCKSLEEIGVKQAQEQCVRLYLRKVLDIAAARVVVVLGEPAKHAICKEFDLPETPSLVEQIQLGNSEIIFTFLPHPNAYKVRTFAKCLTTHQLESLQMFLA